MNKEIEEIISIKKDCDYKRISVDELLVLKDYITNLQEENKSLKEHWVKLIGENLLLNEIQNLQQRIDKAIEYIEEYQDVLKEHNGDWLNYQDGFKPYLLDILQGRLIRKWECQRDIERELGFSEKCISNCALGNQQTAYGYIWKHELKGDSSNE